MFLSAEELSADEVLTADVLIVGSGPAGLTLAWELSARGHDVLVLEGGRMERDEKYRQLGYAEMNGYLRPDHLNVHAARQFGGGWNVWGGVCATIDEGVFTARSFVEGDWGVDADEMTPFYARARDYLRLPEEAASDDADQPFDAAPGLRVKPFFLSPVKFGRTLADRVRGDDRVRCVLGAVVTDIEPAEGGGAVEQLVFVDGDGRRLRARGGAMVLAAGALSNARLLLAHARNYPDPQAWRHVGRWFMEHPHIYDPGFSARLSQKAMGEAGRLTDPSVRSALRLGGREELDADLLAMSYQLVPSDHSPGPFSSYDAVMSGQDQFAVSFIMRGEMEPRFENRIELTEGDDWTGAPQSRAVLELSERDRISTYESAALLVRSLNRSGAGRASKPEPDRVMEGARGGGHFMGVTRMGGDPATSVVNSDGRVHVYDNLYVAGSSVFPTGGASNPTYTIVALAVRLADHLDARVREAG